MHFFPSNKAPTNSFRDIEILLESKNFAKREVLTRLTLLFTGTVSSAYSAAYHLIGGTIHGTVTLFKVTIGKIPYVQRKMGDKLNDFSSTEFSKHLIKVAAYSVFAILGPAVGAIHPRTNVHLHKKFCLNVQGDSGNGSPPKTPTPPPGDKGDPKNGSPQKKPTANDGTKKSDNKIKRTNRRDNSSRPLPPIPPAGTSTPSPNGKSDETEKKTGKSPSYHTKTFVNKLSNRRGAFETFKPDGNFGDLSELEVGEELAQDLLKNLKTNSRQKKEKKTKPSVVNMFNRGQAHQSSSSEVPIPPPPPAPPAVDLNKSRRLNINRNPSQNSLTHTQQQQQREENGGDIGTVIANGFRNNRTLTGLSGRASDSDSDHEQDSEWDS